MLENPNIDVLRIVRTPGIPRSAVVSGYVIWSSMSCGDRPGQSVKTICWLSPMSGIASTETGSEGKGRFHLNGEVTSPQPTSNTKSSIAMSLFSRKKRIIEFIIQLNVINVYRTILQAQAFIGYTKRVYSIDLIQQNLVKYEKRG